MFSDGMESDVIIYNGAFDYYSNGRRDFARVTKNSMDAILILGERNLSCEKDGKRMIK